MLSGLEAVDCFAFCRLLVDLDLQFGVRGFGLACGSFRTGLMDASFGLALYFVF